MSTEGASWKILIVDDEPDTVTYLTAWLEDLGYQTCSAGDGAEGMEAVRRERPHLVLMDVKMPTRTGIEMYRQLRLGDEFCRLPVIFISGMPGYPIFGGECAPLPEPEARIDKPLDLQALRAAIEKSLGPGG